jgi:protein-glucosylgalactosylhydroxylysine glucosidase
MFNKNPKLLICFVLLIFLISCNGGIDRKALVNRHNITLTEISPLNPLTVGNGEFAFTADITGLQTFPEYYEKGIPLGTMAQWCWHSFPNPEKYTLEDVIKYYRVGSDSVPYYFQYADSTAGRKYSATQWLRENPHRLHLGLIGLEMITQDSTLIGINDIQHPVQKLNLWTGELVSEFSIEGTPVKVMTFCQQDFDRIGVRIESKLIAEGRLKVKIDFPYASHRQVGPGYDFSSPDRHSTLVIDSGKNHCLLKRQLDTTVYFVEIDWKEKVGMRSSYAHHFRLEPETGDTTFEFSVSFSREKITGRQPSFAETRENNKTCWKQFWESGGAVDFSNCTDPRAFELERRVILSQYLTRIQCSGSLPPQETGLTYNSWYGKFHLEMHWWHAMHFILWGRPELMEKQLDYYLQIIDKAKETAKLQGYKGVRWPKMTGLEGRESPSTIGVFLIWQEPHIIYFAEELYQYHEGNAEILEKYKDLVFATADFMASYARYDSTRNQYILGPAMIPAQERFAPESTLNPSFELEYWYRALETAQQWRERDGLNRDSRWQHVIDHLAPLPVKDSLYIATETAPDSYTNPQYLGDHPMVLGLMGFLPETDRVDRKIMNNTLDTVLAKWDWKSCWGWDFPMAAMNATLLNRPETAIDLLLMDTPKNTYLPNGHNYQDSLLTIYLPGNGALLTAVAMMCAYRNADGHNGFPDKGQWDVRYEDICPLFSVYQETK